MKYFSNFSAIFSLITLLFGTGISATPVAYGEDSNVELPVILTPNDTTGRNIIILEREADRRPSSSLRRPLPRPRIPRPHVRPEIIPVPVPLVPPSPKNTIAELAEDLANDLLRRDGLKVNAALAGRPPRPKPPQIHGVEPMPFPFPGPINNIFSRGESNKLPLRLPHLGISTNPTNLARSESETSSTATLFPISLLGVASSLRLRELSKEKAKEKD